MKKTNRGFGVDLKEKVVGVYYMRKDDFIDMCKRMVVEYSNRYIRVNDNVSSISIDEVFVEEYTNTQYLKQATLSTPLKNDEKYCIILNQKTKMIESYIVKYNEDDNSLKVGGFRR